MPEQVSNMHEHELRMAPGSDPLSSGPAELGIPLGGHPKAAIDGHLKTGQ